MDKLRKSTLFKIIIIIVFMVALLATTVSGIVSVSLYVDHALTKRGREGLKNEIIANIAPSYTSMALDYYKRYIDGESTFSDKEEFSEENTNYAFTAQAISGSEVWPTLSNYEPDDYQYKDTYFAQIELDEDYDYFERKLSALSIINSRAYMLLSYGDLINLGLFEEEYVGANLWYESEYDDVYLVDANIVNALRYKFIIKNGYDYFGFSGEFNNEYYEEDEYYDEDEIHIDNIAEEYLEATTEAMDASGYDTGAYDTDYDYGEVKYGDAYEYVYHDYSELYDLNTQRKRADDIEFSSFGGDLFEGYDADIVTDGTYYYILQNVDVISAYLDKLRAYNYDDEYSYDYYVGYIDDTQTAYISSYVYRTATVEIDWYLKSKLTAYDQFYNSIPLRYIDLVSTAAIPVFAVSAILLLIAGGLVIAVAGYKKGKDEVSLGLFDKIPYDIPILVFLLMAGIGLSWFDGYWLFYYGRVESVLYGAVILALDAWLTYIFYTTVVRLKCEGFSFLGKLLIVRLVKAISKFAVWLDKKLIQGIKYLWKHLNLYAKYILIILAVLILEVAVAANEGAEFTPVVLVLEKIIVGAILAYSIISIKRIKDYARKLADGEVHEELDKSHMYGAFKGLADDLTNINSGIQNAVNEQMKSEMMKTELITNVSHDIKTPLTSIINYVDLLGKEEIDNPKAQEYLEVLNRQSLRLKKLIVDLIDASKASTGNLEVHPEVLDLDVILTQINGEYDEQFREKRLALKVTQGAEDTHILADGRHLYRVFDNIFVNIRKYAKDDTRVYIDIEDDASGQILNVMIKNISAEELNITGDELMERFTRGDRSRNTEGSGLGLSIARSLMELQGGDMKIVVDGDLFKVILQVPKPQAVSAKNLVKRLIYCET